MDASPLKVLISGGSGMIGSKLAGMLKRNNYEPVILSRNPEKVKEYESRYWDPNSGTLDPEAFRDISIIISLAGAGIADKRWTPARKKIIIDSRVRGNELLKVELEKTTHQVRLFISASAVGYYGETGEKWAFESDNPAHDFLAETCKLWEGSARDFEELGIRVFIPRIGFVLATEGGALPALARQVKWFAGAALGSGKQYLSWIHIDDLCRIFLHAISNEKMQGVFNAVGSDPVTNEKMIKTIAKVLHRPVWPINVPAFLMKLILGERAQLVLSGQRVSAEKLIQTGFEFQNKKLEQAVESLLK